jgi:hypothetical protein
MMSVTMSAIARAGAMSNGQESFPMATVLLASDAHDLSDNRWHRFRLLIAVLTYVDVIVESDGDGHRYLTPAPQLIVRSSR